MVHGLALWLGVVPLGEDSKLSERLVVNFFTSLTSTSGVCAVMFQG